MMVQLAVCWEICNRFSNSNSFAFSGQSCLLSHHQHLNARCRELPFCPEARALSQPQPYMGDGLYSPNPRVSVYVFLCLCLGIPLLGFTTHLPWATGSSIPFKRGWRRTGGKPSVFRGWCGTRAPQSLPPASGWVLSPGPRRSERRAYSLEDTTSNLAICPILLLRHAKMTHCSPIGDNESLFNSDYCCWGPLNVMKFPWLTSRETGF